MLKIISGIDSLQKGYIEVYKRPIHRYSRKALAKTLSFVPQNIPLDFPFTVAQTVLMGRYPHLGVLGIEGGEDVKLVHRMLTFAGGVSSGRPKD